MFPTLFPYGLGAPKFVTCQKKSFHISSCEYLMNLDDKDHGFAKHHLFIFFMFNLIQRRQICLGTKLTISRSSFVKESQLLNKIQSIDFNVIIENPKLAFSKPNIKNLLHHLKTSSRHVLAFGSS